MPPGKGHKVSTQTLQSKIKLLPYAISFSSLEPVLLQPLYHPSYRTVQQYVRLSSIYKHLRTNIMNTYDKDLLRVS